MQGTFSRRYGLIEPGHQELPSSGVSRFEIRLLIGEEPPRTIQPLATLLCELLLNPDQDTIPLVRCILVRARRPRSPPEWPPAKPRLFASSTTARRPGSSGTPPDWWAAGKRPPTWHRRASSGSGKTG